MTATSRILVDARMLWSSGIGTYLRATLPRVMELRPNWRWRVLGNPIELSKMLWADRTGVEIVAWNAGIYSLSGCWRLPTGSDRECDLAWFPHYVHPRWLRLPFVATVHDVFHLAMPHLAGNRLMRAAAAWQLRDVCRRARRVMTDTQFSANEFTRLVGAPVKSPVVIPCAVDPAWSSARTGNEPHPRPYVVAVGNTKPHKNLLRVMQAFCDPRLAGLDLVIVGQRDGFIVADESLAGAARDLGNRVVFTGKISDEAVRSWVGHASALVFATLYEGFGLPPLEAMLAEVPVVASRIPPVVEVCGEAVEYVDPYDPADIARGVQTVLALPRATELIARGRQQVTNYSWDASALQITNVFDVALAP